MKKILWVCTDPCCGGDETSGYSGTVQVEMTVKDFLEEELNFNEWGKVFSNKKIAEYGKGQLNLLVEENSPLLKKVLRVGDKIRARGGWTLMDYWI